MVFRSKIDFVFISVIAFSVIITGGVFLLPLLIDETAKSDMIVSLSLFALTTGFLLWISFSIRYIFKDGYLLIKSGPIKKRIPYESVTRITPTSEILSGFRILSSKDSYEVFYKDGSLGSIKISPKDAERFINELKNRCPNLTIAS